MLRVQFWIKSLCLGFDVSLCCLKISVYEERVANTTRVNGDKCAECAVLLPVESVAGCVRWDPLLLMLECKSYDIKPPRYN